MLHIHTIFNIGKTPVVCHTSCLLWLLLPIPAKSILGGLALALTLFLILTVHEVGHLLIARRLGYTVHGLAIYPAWGKAVFERPSRQAHMALICCGGVLAQGVLLICVIVLLLIVPLHILSEYLGDARVGILVLTVYNGLIMAFNLLPLKGLDGQHAWKTIPAFFKGEYRRAQRTEKTSTNHSFEKRGEEYFH